MADAEDPKRRPAGPGPGQPLPRLWKAEPEAEDEEVPKRDRRARRAEAEAESAKAKADDAPKAKPKAKSGDKKSTKAGDKEKAKGKGVLLEDTPELDTQQSRERIRMAIGGVVGIIVIGVIIVLLQGLNKSPTDDMTDLVNEGAASGDASPIGGIPVGKAAPAAKDVAEQEAELVLTNARQLAKNGKIKEATGALERVIKSYPKTKTAALAKEALARPNQNLPLFVDDGVVVASAPLAATLAPAAPNAGAPVVVAVDANGGSNATITAGKMPSNATVQLPANASETPKAPSEGSATAKAKPAVAARPLPRGFHIEPESGVHASGWPYQIVSERDGAILVLVPGDSFTIGRDDGTPDEAPSHKVQLTSFYVDQHEVTNRQFELYLKETGRKRTTKSATKDLPKTRTEDDPVTGVTLVEARAYCEWAGKAVPTEAQWEAAARSTDGRLYPWGSSKPTWSKPRLPRQIDPVGTYPLDQSPYGTIDMAGNAWEWTADWFDSKYYQTVKGQVLVNPLGPQASRAVPPQVVVKGGSKKWVVAWREGLKADTKLPYVGFRGVLQVEATPAAEVAAPASITPGPGQPAVPVQAKPATKGGTYVPF